MASDNPEPVEFLAVSRDELVEILQLYQVQESLRWMDADTNGQRAWHAGRISALSAMVELIECGLSWTSVRPTELPTPALDYEKLIAEIEAL